MAPETLSDLTRSRLLGNSRGHGFWRAATLCAMLLTRLNMFSLIECTESGGSGVVVAKALHWGEQVRHGCPGVNSCVPPA